MLWLPLRSCAAATLVLLATPTTPCVTAATLPGITIAAQPTATAAVSQKELERITDGLARVDYLLQHWEEETTACSGVSAGGELEDKQVARTQNQAKCFKTPLRVQKYIGASSTLDPLFRVDKIMIRATALVDDAEKDDYNDAVDAFITRQQISSTMAYTSSWSGIENPNGSVEQIEDNLLEAKKEVLATQDTLQKIVNFLHLSPAPPYTSEPNL